MSPNHTETEDQTQTEFMGFDAYQQAAGDTDQIDAVVDEMISWPVRRMIAETDTEIDKLKYLLDDSELSLALSHHVLGLTSEAGEVAGKIKKLMRDDRGVLSPQVRDSIKAELGDVLWYLARTAALLQIDLSEVAAHNLTKLRSRANRGKINGSGDVR